MPENTPIADLIEHYLQPIPLDSLPPINTGLSSASEDTMIAKFGSPQMPLTTTDQPHRASALVKQLAQTVNITNHITANGIRPSVKSLQGLLSLAFAQEAATGHNLENVLSSLFEMLNVRLRNPTSGIPSTKISNHAWGTAIDLSILGHPFPGNTHEVIPRFIAVLLPFFNNAGWYSGIGFRDTMHFEVANETIIQWAADGEFTP